MQTLLVTIEIENVSARGEHRAVEQTLVNANSPLTWVPRAILESLEIKSEKSIPVHFGDGRIAQRDVGIAIVRVAGAETIDDVVFAEPGDRVALGARSLSGMNLRVDSRENRLVAGGPLPAAAA